MASPNAPCRRRPLERDGLVEIESDPSDRRSKILRLTKCRRSAFPARLPARGYPSSGLPHQRETGWLGRVISGAAVKFSLPWLVCGLRNIFRDMGPLSQAPAEGNVLARDFVERDHQIIRRDSGRRNHTVVQGLQ